MIRPTAPLVSATRFIDSRQRRLRCLVPAVMVTALLGLIPIASLATPITISGDTNNSTSMLGDFSGTLNYSFSSSTSGNLVFSLENTSPSANGGFITGFVLNNPGDKIDSITSHSFTDTDFSVLGLSDNGINGAPFGQFDFGAALGGNFQGGGNPHPGIGVGDNATFTFNFSGTNLDELSSQSFIDELSDGSTGAGEGTQFLAVRFRGFEDGGSDKVPGTTNTTPPTPVSEPPEFLLFTLGLSLLGLGLYARKRWQA